MSKLEAPVTRAIRREFSAAATTNATADQPIDDTMYGRSADLDSSFGYRPG
jgi:hypothetical protein